MSVVSMTPLVFLYVTYKQREHLDQEPVRKSIGSIYEGKNVNNKGNYIFLYPMLFFWRRIFFIVVTVGLFKQPAVQMIVHYLLTMMTVLLLVFDRKFYQS